jgi:hypothetical protein
MFYGAPKNKQKNNKKYRQKRSQRSKYWHVAAGGNVSLEEGEVMFLDCIKALAKYIEILLLTTIFLRTYYRYRY